jgi:hypothetical protein
LCIRDAYFPCNINTTYLWDTTLGELGTCLWLIVKGLNVDKWDERVRIGPVFDVVTEVTD